MSVVITGASGAFGRQAAELLLRWGEGAATTVADVRLPNLFG